MSEKPMAQVVVELSDAQWNCVSNMVRERARCHLCAGAFGGERGEYALIGQPSVSRATFSVIKVCPECFKELAKVIDARHAIGYEAVKKPIPDPVLKTFPNS